MPSIRTKKSAGFTLIEMLVVAPIVLLLIGAIIAYITTLTGKSLQIQAKNSMAFDIQDALDSVESDSSRATRYLTTTGTLPSPQGKDSNFNGTAAFTSSDSLVLGVIATTKNPSDPDRAAVYFADQPNACAADKSSNSLFLIKVVYFLKDGSLWRRSLVPTWNKNTPSDDFTVCDTPWQQNSCSPGYTAASCTAEDEELVKNVSAFTVKYYATPASTTELAASAADTARSVEVSIAGQQTVAGQTVSQSGSVRVARINDINQNLIAPTATPSVTYSFTNTTSVNFSWDSIPNATSYKISYSINGGAYTNTSTTDTNFTVNANRLDTVTFKVTGRNGFGVTPTTQVTAQLPSQVPCNLQSGWGNYNGGYDTASFTKTSAGVVSLSGLISKATTPSLYEVICTLPEGYRPSSRLIFTTQTAGAVQSRIDLETNGDVIYIYGSNSWLSLVGINFLADGTVSWLDMAGSNSWHAYGAPYAPPQAAVDSLGRTFIQGLAAGGTTTAGTTAFTLPSSVTGPSAYEADIYPSRNAYQNSFQVNPAKTVTVRYGSAYNGYWSLQSITYPNGIGTQTALPLAAGWVNYGSGYNAATYIKSSDGLVSLQGLIRSGTATSGTTIATLPAGYRPSAYIICSTVTSPDVAGRVDVWPTGQVIIREGVSNGWLSLAGCDFVAKQ